MCTETFLIRWYLTEQIFQEYHLGSMMKRWKMKLWTTSVMGIAYYHVSF